MTSNEMLIGENDYVIVQKGNNLKSIQVKKNRQIWMEKMIFEMNGAIGQPYGTTFEVKGKSLFKIEDDSKNTGECGDFEKDVEITTDNRSLTDSSDNQKLSKEDIHAMRKEGVSGQDLVEKIIENSATFKDKTEFSKQKYIRKKKKKHLPVFKVLKPSSRLIAEMHFNKSPSKICHLRLDSLSQLLVQANVRANCKMMVVESCAGLVLGAVMERMGGRGSLVNLYAGSASVRQGLDIFNFPKDYFNTLHGFPLNKLNSIEQPISDGLDEFKPGGVQLDARGISDKPEDVDMEESTDKKADDTEKTSDSPTPPNSTETSGGEKRKHEIDKEKEKLLKKAVRDQELEKTRQMIMTKDMDGLIVVSKYHPTAIVLNLIKYVAPSRQIVVFSSTKEPLIDCYSKLRDRGGVINLHLTETWLREHQVLPSRTHPQINMHSASGYLLYGTTVELD